MNPQETLEKVDLLIKKLADPEYPEDKEKVLEWKAKLERAMIVKDLSEHEGIQMIIEKLKSDLEDIRKVLNTAKSDQLSVLARDNMIEKKKLYLWFLRLFPKADETIKEVEEAVDKEDNLSEE